MELSDSRLQLRSCSCVPDDTNGMLCVGRLTDVDTGAFWRRGGDVAAAAAAALPTTAAPARATVTLETGANKPHNGVQLKYLNTHTGQQPMQISKTMSFTKMDIKR